MDFGTVMHLAAQQIEAAAGTLRPVPTLHKMDRRHAYAERMPTAC
jgi:hypothetical protein